MKKNYWRSLFLNVNGLQRLRTSEFFTFYDEFITRLDSFVFEDVFVIVCIDALLSHKDTVSLLKTWKRAHDVSELIDDLSNKSRELLMGIRDAIFAAEKLKNAENEEAISLLVNWIRDVRVDMSSNTKAYQTDAIYTLVERVEADTELAEAVENYGLMSHFYEVIKMKNQMVAYRSLRDNDNTQGKDLRNGLRARIQEDIRLTLGVLEARAKHDVEKGEFYFEVCRNIEKLIVTAYTPPKARNTRSMNEKHADNDMLPEDVDDIRDGDSDEFPSDHVGDENNEQSL